MISLPNAEAAPQASSNADAPGASVGSARGALIMTVGLELHAGGGLLEALARAADASRYERLILIPSPQSEPDARRLADRIDWPSGSIRIESTGNAHDLDGVFRTVNSTILRLISQGYSQERITINYTSGTKVMSSAAALAAIYNSCEKLEYITGSGDGSRRIATLSTQPRAIFAYRDLLRARAHALATQFRSASTSLEGIDELLLTDHDSRLTTNLRVAVAAYSAWEANRIPEFLSRYGQVEFGAAELGPFRLRSEQEEPLRQLALDVAGQGVSTRFCAHMRNSAWRLLREGHYEEAVERLYRGLEILAQWTLKSKHGISADNVNIRQAPARYRASFEALRSLDDGVVRVGMRKAYELLMLLEEPVGRDFFADGAVQGCLKMRDSSLLAHGTVPVSGEACAIFLKTATGFFRRHIEGFDALREALQFPWLREEAAADEAPAKG